VNIDAEKVTINGKVYFPEDFCQEQADSFDGMEYKIIRTQSAGVFAGFLEKRNGQEAIIRKARRIWFWDGASSLSQLAEEGTKKPENCKFPCEVEKIELTQVIEVLSVTKKGQKSIQSVKVWEQ
jgi:hypothetical protein